MDSLKQKFFDSIISILPIMIIILIVGSFLQFSVTTILSIVISTILLVIGISLFTYGSEISMIEIGKSIGSSLVNTKSPLFIFIISIIVGIIITIAEPDLKVLASQMTAINPKLFILIVSSGVGLFLSLATMRIIYQIDLKLILWLTYGVIILLMFIVNKEMLPISFDAGGVTTGPMSVPFIVAMGVGFSKARSRKESKNDSFGLVALCSIGPVLTVLLLSLFMDNNLSYTYDIGTEITSLSELFNSYISQALPTLKDVSISLLPILILFIIFNISTRNIQKQKLKRVIFGLIVSFIGISLFFIGVTSGYMKIAYLIGVNMADKQELLIILGVIIGFVIVKAEPAVAVLTEQIERITLGSINKKLINGALSIGVALAISLSILRVLNGMDILPFLVGGYLISLVLMFFTPKLFTMVAFDAGGAISGPMTSSFLLPLVIGVCYVHGGDVFTDAFGLVALVALSPLITIQILGFIYSVKLKIESQIRINESIIEYDWKCNNG